MKARPDGKSWQCFDTFEVDGIEIQNKRIVKLAIKNTKSGKICFTWSNGTATPEPKKKEERHADMMFQCAECGEIMKPYIGENGKEIGVRRHYQASIQKFGMPMCINCIEKKKKEGTNA